MSPKNPYGGAGPMTLAISWTQAAIAIILVLLRAFAARSHADRLRWDFVYVAIGTIFGIATQVALTRAVLFGVGNHIENVPYPDLVEALHMSWVAILVGLIGITGAKLSISALLLNITIQTQKLRRGLLWGAGLVSVFINTAQIIFVVTQCSPLKHTWDRISPGTCRGEVISNDFGYLQGAAAILADVFLALYPVTVVWNLKLSTRSKIGFCCLMAGGLLPAAAGIIRTTLLKHLTSTVDVTYEFFPFLLWAITEMWMVIILGSIPPLRPLFKRIVLGAKSTTSSTSRSTAVANSRHEPSKTRSRMSLGVVSSTSPVAQHCYLKMNDVVDWQGSTRSNPSSHHVSIAALDGDEEEVRFIRPLPPLPALPTHETI